MSISGYLLVVMFVLVCSNERIINEEDQRNTSFSSLPRVALCLYGLHKGHNEKVNSGFHNLEDQMLKRNGTEFFLDVFMHSYDTEYEDIVVPAYRPRAYLLEERKNWTDFISAHKIEDNTSIPHYRPIEINLSQLSSIKKSVSLKRQHEISEGFRYTFVVVARVDACVRISCLSFNPLLPTWRVYTHLYSQLNTGPMQDHFWG